MFYTDSTLEERKYLFVLYEVQYVRRITLVRKTQVLHKSLVFTGREINLYRYLFIISIRVIHYLVYGWQRIAHARKAKN
jgi:hypothetical protein